MSERRIGPPHGSVGAGAGASVGVGEGVRVDVDVGAGVGASAGVNVCLSVWGGRGAARLDWVAKSSRFGNQAGGANGVERVGGGGSYDRL